MTTLVDALGGPDTTAPLWIVASAFVVAVVLLVAVIVWPLDDERPFCARLRRRR